MFYVLNFENHRFFSCDTAAKAETVISTQLSNGCQTDSLEIINGFGDDVRLSVDQFRNLCKEQGLLEEDPAEIVSSSQFLRCLDGSFVDAQKLQSYLKDEMILEFASAEECMKYFNTYDGQNIQSVEELKAFQDQYGFGIGSKWYHINFDEALDVKPTPSLKIFHQNEEECAVFRDAIRYWSNASGELHYHGKYSIEEKDLPEPLQRVYKDLFFEGEFSSLRYLVETGSGYGIALINEYDCFTAESSGISMKELFKAVEKDAEIIASDPAFSKAEVFAGEFVGFNECHDLTVVFPADISTEEFMAAAAKLEELAYQSAIHFRKPPLTSQIDAAASRVEKASSARDGRTKYSEPEL